MGEDWGEIEDQKTVEDPPTISANDNSCPPPSTTILNPEQEYLEIQQEI